MEAGLVESNERCQKSGRFISFAYIQYITYEFVTGCSSTWHKLGIYNIYVHRGSIKFQVAAKCVLSSYKMLQPYTLSAWISEPS